MNQTPAPPGGPPAAPAAGNERTAPPAPYDALLVQSFGGPERPEDVMPFLLNVTRGRGVPPERLEAVAEHYHHLGGRSPINDQNRALLAAVRAELSARGLSVGVYWGNRNWDPYLADTLRQAHADGARRIAVLATSAYASYSGCRQYREDLARALAEIGDAGRELTLDKIRHYYHHPGFIAPMVDGVRQALAALPAGPPARTRMVFVTHSVPVGMAEAAGPDGGGYVRQHHDACRSVMAGVSAAAADGLARPSGWDLVYCSRSGAPGQAWLEPDIADHLRVLAAAGTSAVVVVPIGFVSDHMEVVYDLDTEAAEVATELGMEFRRVPTVGTDPRFVAGLVDLLLERAAAERGEHAVRPAVGELAPSPDRCPAGCCRNPRADLPAACGADWAGLADTLPEGARA